MTWIEYYDVDNILWVSHNRDICFYITDRDELRVFSSKPCITLFFAIMYRHWTVSKSTALVKILLSGSLL